MIGWLMRIDDEGDEMRKGNNCFLKFLKNFKFI